MPQQRELKFNTYTNIIQEIESLQQNGYSKGGNWSLGQICRHLSYYYKGSLDGFSGKLPWIIKVTFGKWTLKKLLSERKSKPGSPTDPKSVFPAENDDKVAIGEAITLLKRLEANTASLKPSGFFGELTNEQWSSLHRGHSAHHLSFLMPSIKK